MTLMIEMNEQKTFKIKEMREICLSAPSCLRKSTMWSSALWHHEVM